MPTIGPEIHVAAGALRDAAGRVLIAKRPEGVHQGGLWEFPGGKLEPGETARAALARELDEELGIQVELAEPLIQVRHDYGDRRILLDVYDVRGFQGDPRGREGQPLRWCDPQGLDPNWFPAADRPILSALRLPRLCLITSDAISDPARLLRQLEASLDAAMRAASSHKPSILEESLPQDAGSSRPLSPLITEQSADNRVSSVPLLVQFRAPQLSDADYRALVPDIHACCARVGAHLVLNRDPMRVADLPVDGLHLNARILRTLDARPGDPGQLLGASCHDAEELALAAALGLDYALLSPVQLTQTHPQANPLGWAQFARLVAEARIPVYGLGGLGPEDLSVCFEAGGQGIATIRGLWVETH